MSKYVIKVFEKQENGDLIPHAFDEADTQFEMEAEGYFIAAISQKKVSDTKMEVNSEIAMHDITAGALGSALYECSEAREAMMNHSKKRLLEKLLSGELEPKERNEDAAE